MLDFMCRYIELLLTYVNVRNLLFIAIDGPPPRAKLEQQRERRFQKDLERRSSPTAETEWDSNQITPGTTFMSNVSQKLNEFCFNKLANDPEWKNVCLISAYKPFILTYNKIVFSGDIRC